MINFLFYLTFIIGIVTSIPVIMIRNTKHCLMYLAVFFLAMATLLIGYYQHVIAAIFFIFYVLFILSTLFIIIRKYHLYNDVTEQASYGISPKRWFIPTLLSILCLIMLFYLIISNDFNISMPLLININYGQLTVKIIMFMIILTLVIAAGIFALYQAIKLNNPTAKKG